MLIRPFSRPYIYGDLSFAAGLVPEERFALHLKTMRT